LTTLDAISSHPSKASSAYYLDQYLQYFGDLVRSLMQIRSVCRRSADCILVVQDSLYKDVHVNLPRITKEIATYTGFEHVRSHEYAVPTSFRHLNSRSRKYRLNWTPREAVLWFKAA